MSRKVVSRKCRIQDATLWSGLVIMAANRVALLKQVRDLFHELADLAPADRARVYGERNIAAEIREEVESLLHLDQDDSEGDSFFTQSVVASAAEMADAAIPEYCGAYRLLRKLGQGGMG